MPQEPERRASLAQLLTKAKELKQQRDAKDAEILAKIPVIEAALKELSLGTRLSLELSQEEDAGQGLTWSRYLIYGKLSNRWQLFVEESYGEPDLPHNEIPLKNVSREELVSIFRHRLRDLIEGAAKNLRNTVKERDEALQEANELIEDLSQLAQPETNLPTEKPSTADKPKFAEAFAASDNLAKKATKAETQKGVR